MMADECPLCVNEFEEADKGFLPCSCGYKVCYFCWDRIKSEGTGQCPACRQKYDDVAKFESPSRVAVSKTHEERVVKDRGPLKKRPVGGISSSSTLGAGSSASNAPAGVKSSLLAVRVVQRNLVYVIGVPPSMGKEEVLRKKAYFGQYGDIVKVVINKNAVASEAGRLSSVSAYITYSKEEEARSAIIAVDGFWYEGRCLRCMFGTTKYCHSWLKEQTCTSPDCLYLHKWGEDADSFNKLEMDSENTFGNTFRHLVHPNHGFYNGNGIMGGVGGTSFPPSQAQYSLESANAAKANGTVLPPVPDWLVDFANLNGPPPTNHHPPGRHPRSGGYNNSEASESGAYVPRRPYHPSSYSGNHVNSRYNSHVNDENTDNYDSEDGGHDVGTPSHGSHGYRSSTSRSAHSNSPHHGNKFSHHTQYEMHSDSDNEQGHESSISSSKVNHSDPALLAAVAAPPSRSVPTKSLWHTQGGAVVTRSISQDASSSSTGDASADGNSGASISYKALTISKTNSQSNSASPSPSAWKAVSKSKIDPSSLGASKAETPRGQWAAVSASSSSSSNASFSNISGDGAAASAEASTPEFTAIGSVSDNNDSKSQVALKPSESDSVSERNQEASATRTDPDPLSTIHSSASASWDSNSLDGTPSSLAVAPGSAVTDSSFASVSPPLVQDTAGNFDILSMDVEKLLNVDSSFSIPGASNTTGSSSLFTTSSPGMLGLNALNLSSNNSLNNNLNLGMGMGLGMNMGLNLNPPVGLNMPLNIGGLGMNMLGHNSSTNSNGGSSSVSGSASASHIPSSNGFDFLNLDDVNLLGHFGNSTSLSMNTSTVGSTPSTGIGKVTPPPGFSNPSSSLSSWGNSFNVGSGSNSGFPMNLNNLNMNSNSMNMSNLNMGMNNSNIPPGMNITHNANSMGGITQMKGFPVFNQTINSTPSSNSTTTSSFGMNMLGANLPFSSGFNVPPQSFGSPDSLGVAQMLGIVNNSNNLNHLSNSSSTLNNSTLMESKQLLSQLTTKQEGEASTTTTTSTDDSDSAQRALFSALNIGMSSSAINAKRAATSLKPHNQMNMVQGLPNINSLGTGGLSSTNGGSSDKIERLFGGSDSSKVSSNLNSNSSGSTNANANANANSNSNAISNANANVNANGNVSASANANVNANASTNGTMNFNNMNMNMLKLQQFFSHGGMNMNGMNFPMNNSNVFPSITSVSTNNSNNISSNAVNQNVGNSNININNNPMDRQMHLNQLLEKAQSIRSEGSSQLSMGMMNNFGAMLNSMNSNASLNSNLLSNTTNNHGNNMQLMMQLLALQQQQQGMNANSTANNSPNTGTSTNALNSLQFLMSTMKNMGNSQQPMTQLQQGIPQQMNQSSQSTNLSESTKQ